MARGGGTVSVAEIQGNILRGYRSDHAEFVFARVTDAGAARRWLGELIDVITFNGSPGARRPDHTVNVAFTCAGLRALGVPAERVSGLGAFAAGMARRAELLGDLGPCAPKRWQPGLRATHVLVTLTASDPEQVRRADRELADAGLERCHMQLADKLLDAREHFGFADGFSQPAIAGASTGPRDGEGTLTRSGRWRDIALGEFVLGRPDEGGAVAPGPTAPLGRDATYMVVRKLEQDVAAFRAYTAAQAQRCGRDADWVAARMVGRWKNGSALARHPDRPGPAAADERERANRFGYADDRAGAACPLGAHVRRANPRDALGWGGRLTQRHRLLRRGMSYGPPLPAGALEGDGAERGLMFVSYQASIERQFEFIQKQWLGDGNVFGLGDDRDPIVAGAEQMVIQSSGPPLFLTQLPRFVTTRGGDYFLVPGRAGLAAIASGEC
jgi:Dyp-type peroxidase family